MNFYDIIGTVHIYGKSFAFGRKRFIIMFNMIHLVNDFTEEDLERWVYKEFKIRISEHLYTNPTGSMISISIADNSQKLIDEMCIQLKLRYK